uniref:ABC transporter domain-containing protein n=1 Tax=Glossina morsitans morsitans TaxID=37546 RepID=A0A1B0FCM7_GLOMM
MAITSCAVPVLADDAAAEGGKIGISMPTQSLERWNRDGSYLEEQFKAAGFDVELTYSDNETDRQLSMVKQLNTVMDEAADAGIPVIAYDRLIKSDAVSYYISFDNYTVGTLQGQYVIDTLDLDNAGDKTYNIEFTAGDPADNNAGYFFNGAYDTLKPYLDAGTLNVVSGQTDFDSVATAAWDTQTALERMQNILASYYADGTQLDVALCSNDSTALGVTQAIESDYAGKNDVLITGQDGDEANLANIVDGKQSMTVYKAVANEAVVTLDLAEAMLKGDTIDDSLITNSKWDFDCAYDTESYETSEGHKCPSFLLVPTVRGEIHALIGENGAGKSTLMNVLSGQYPYGSYTGTVTYEGEECKFKNLNDSEAKGIVIIHQELALIPLLSIGENMFLGNEIKNKRGSIDWDRTYSEAEKHMAQVGLHESAQTLIKDIGTGKQQLVEIAKAFSKKVKLLILDEPTSSLNDEDAKMLLDLLMEFKKNGLTSIIITHKLNEIIYCADRCTIIRDGTTIETLTKGVDDLSEDRIIKGMVGRSMDDRYPSRKHKVSNEVMLEVKNWTVHHPLYPEKIVDDSISCKVHKGEVVGFSGLQGAGRTEFAMSVFGKSYGSNISGELYIKGEKVNLKNPQEAIRHGLSYVTEDRKTNGLILGESIRFNTTLARLSKVCEKGIINTDMEVHMADEMTKEMGTKTPSNEQKIGNLSGGNQQKALLGKWMFTEPDILILDEPTRGIDVGAKYDIYCLINKMVEEGKSVIMISSEMPELLAPFIGDECIVQIVYRGHAGGLCTWPRGIDTSGTQHDPAAYRTVQYGT